MSTLRRGKELTKLKMNKTLSPLKGIENYQLQYPFFKIHFETEVNQQLGGIRVQSKVTI